jgi:glycosyltransferase involved in cell wall biosynthesis
MHIGFVIYGSLDTLSGGYLYDRMVVEELIRLGHEVEVIGLPSGSYLKRLWLGFSPGLCRRLQAGRFDILIQDELCHPSLFLINRRLKRQNGDPAAPLLVALVHHVLSDEPRPPWHNMLLSLAEKRFLASVDGFIHNSETTRRKVASLVKHNRPQVVAYPAGDRFERPESSGGPGSPLSAEIIGKRVRRPGPLQLLFLGNVIPRKGLLPLLQALAGIHREVWHLSIVGGLDFDSDYTAKAQQLVRQLGLSDSVRFLGPLQEAELVEVLRTSHVFCMPYAYEGFGIAILEAMAFGLPGIGCQNGAAGETISHGVNGFLLAKGDLAGLEPLLIQMHKDRETLLQMALAARATYLGHPTWQESIAAIDNFLQGLVDLRNQKKLFSPVRKPETSEPRNSDATR